MIFYKRTEKRKQKGEGGKRGIGGKKKEGERRGETRRRKGEEAEGEKLSIPHKARVQLNPP